MFDIETLLSLRLTSAGLPAWTVMVFVLLVSFFVLMRRIDLCLLTTYLFTFYWGFSLHWGTFLASGVYSIAFVVYTIAGLAIPGLIVMAKYFSGGPDATLTSPRNRP